MKKLALLSVLGLLLSTGAQAHPICAAPALGVSTAPGTIAASMGLATFMVFGFPAITVWAANNHVEPFKVIGFKQVDYVYPNTGNKNGGFSS